MSMYKLDAAKRDALTAFMTKQLTAYDMRLNEPLMGETEWPKLLSMRTNVTVGDEATGFLREAWTANGGINTPGISWAGRRVNGTLPTVGIDDEQVVKPLRPWLQAVDYTVFELEAAQKLGRNLGDLKVRVVNKKYELDMDHIVTTGDSSLGFTGLFNDADVTSASATNGSWASAQPLDIVEDINDAAKAIYQASGYSHAPDMLVLPPDQFALITTTPMSATIPDITIYDWLKRRSFSTVKNARELTIVDSKYLPGLGAGSTDRFVMYTKDINIVRIAGTPLTTMPVQVQGITYLMPIYGVIGEVEIVYPTTVGYVDGI